MKKIVFLLASALLSSSAVFSQGEMNAYKYSQTDLSGTARYMGMAGAFGALGGDISSMSSNPAGLGIYRSSEVVTTMSLSSIKTKTNWLGNKLSDDKTKFNFDNIAYVGYFPTSNDAGIMSWNVGFSYNRVKNYSRNYRANAANLPNSLTDYIADVTNRLDPTPTGNGLWQRDGSDPYLRNNWLSALGYNSGLIMSSNPAAAGGFYSPFVNAAGQPDHIDHTQLRVSEKGAIDQYDFSFATNVSNIVFLGATFAVTDMNYRMTTMYDETFSAGAGDLYMDNQLKTEGTGYSFNLGAIVRPMDYLRFGVAYNSPVWYKMTSYYQAEAGSMNYNLNDESTGKPGRKYNAYTPNGAYSNFEFRSPERWIFSAAAILGKDALLSVDYELTNYKGMRLADENGLELTGDNDMIRTDFKMERKLKVGAEVKVTPQFAVRAGGAWVESPMKADVRNGNIEILPAGTVPNYTVDKGTSYYTVGLGYRFTPNFYLDLACVFRTQKEDVYAFSSTFTDDHHYFVQSIPASMKTKTTQVALTIGYKF